MVTFNVEIELGNEAMQDGYDISSALTGISNKIKNCSTGDFYDMTIGELHTILDINGNSVGCWWIGD